MMRKGVPGIVTATLIGFSPPAHAQTTRAPDRPTADAPVRSLQDPQRSTDLRVRIPSRVGNQVLISSHASCCCQKRYSVPLSRILLPVLLPGSRHLANSRFAIIAEVG
jgi:hypothetical protein